MAQEDPLTWEIESYENFLDTHFLFRGVHKVFWKYWENLDEIEPNFFSIPRKQDKYELLVDWSKYAKPNDTFQHLNPDLSEYGIIEFNVGKLNNCIRINNFPIGIRHDPIRKITKNQKFINRAHSLIERFTKNNYAKIRTELSLLAKWSDGFKPIR